MGSLFPRLLGAIGSKVMPLRGVFHEGLRYDLSGRGDRARVIMHEPPGKGWAIRVIEESFCRQPNPAGY